MSQGRYSTQGGGVCEYTQEGFRWVEPPDDPCFSDMQAGDLIPEEWGTVAINQEAHEEMEALE